MLANLIILMSAYAMALAAAHLLVNMTGQMLLSLGAWWALAAYVCAACLKVGLPPAAAMMAGVCGSVAAGVVHWLLATRLAKLSYALSTLAVQQILIAVPASISFFGGRQGIFGIARGNTQVLLIFSVIILVLLPVFFNLLRRTKFAKHVSALRQDRLAAESVGVRPDRVWLKLYLLSSLLMGGAGVLHCFHLGSVFYAGFSIHLSVLLLLAVITVRFAGYFAPVLGAILLVGVPELIRILPFGIRNPEFLRNILFAALAVSVLLMHTPRIQPRRRVGVS